MKRYSPMQLFLNARKNTLPENIWVCIAAALIPTFYFYEYQYESFGSIREPLLLIMAPVIFILWISCSLFSGRDGRFGFAIFTFVYWGLPYAYTLFYAGRDNIRQYNKWLAMINKVCSALLCNPFSEVSSKTNIAPQVFAALLVIISLAVYMGGFFLKHRFDAKLADNSGEGYDGEYSRGDEDEDDTPELPESEIDVGQPVTFGAETGKKKDLPDLKSALGIADSDSGRNINDDDTGSGESDPGYDAFIDDILRKR